MKWQDVRNIFPDQFVKLEIKSSTIDKNQEWIEEVAVIGPVSDEDATRELLSSDEAVIVYHTSKEELRIRIRNYNGLRRQN
ncbi:MAG TPA: hypothetical protein IAA29_10280 [Candidatus Paenibacillus intestinavium]|nr:hypothetical protein [Candidatus Paenibacillus intestinavium]